MRYVRGRMRVVHISDTSFITLPEGVSLLVRIDCGTGIRIGSHSIYFASEAHTLAEYRRFVEWLCSDDKQPFRFDLGYPVKTIETGADTPARLVGTLHPPEPLPVAGEIDTLRGEVAP